MPKQPHTEETILHTDDEQDTGNHKVPGAPDAGGADRFGGTRAGAENVEHGTNLSPARSGSAEHATGGKADSVERVGETDAGETPVTGSPV